MKNFRKPKGRWNSTVLVGIMALVGCADPTKDLTEPTASSIKKIEAIKPTAQAGIDKDVTKSMNPDRLKGLIASASRFGYRSNPFELSADERKFDDLQASEKFLSDAGHFPNSFELPEDKAEEVIVQEAQPYRRISGIVIGDAVYAILEQDGRSTIIRPGMTIPETSWVVVSINRDGVTLRRSGNVLPNEVTVRLEVAPPGMSSGAPAGGAPGGGRSSSGPLGGEDLK